MATLLQRWRIRQTWPTLVRRTLHEAFWDDNCLGMSAQLAYFFFFALFPALLVLIAIASFFPLATLVDDAVALLGPFVPPEALTLITDQLRKLSEGNRGGLLTVGMLAALWSSSTAMTAISDTLNHAYDVEEGRPWWKVRLIAIALTVGVAFFILVATALVLAGPAVAGYLADWWYLGVAFEWTWTALQWPLVFVLVTAAIGLIYYFAPDVEQEWTWLVPGAIVATTLWLLATGGKHLGDIGWAVQEHAEANGYSIVRDYVGHGIGRRMHEDPQIPNYGRPGLGPKIKSGYVFAIEPMVNLGSHHTKVLKEQWTVVTVDGQPSAHVEHTIAITEEGPEVLTLVREASVAPA